MRDEDGSMAVAMSAAVAIVAVLAVAVASIGTLYAARAQATNAADAAALAAAVSTYPPASTTSPVVAASGAARSNGATLDQCQCPVDGGMGDRTVEVTAMVRATVPIFGEIPVRVSSRAEFSPREWVGR